MARSDGWRLVSRYGGRARHRLRALPGPLYHSRPAGATRRRLASSCTDAEEQGWRTGTDHAQSTGDASASDPSSSTHRIAANAVLSLGALRCGTPGGREMLRKGCCCRDSRSREHKRYMIYSIFSPPALAHAPPMKGHFAARRNGIFTRQPL
jgi:hypothetical protein